MVWNKFTKRSSGSNVVHIDEILISVVDCVQPTKVLIYDFKIKVE